MSTHTLEAGATHFQSASHLYHRPLDELLAEAWATRQRHFPPRLYLAAPGAKHYQVATFSNDPRRFVPISLTGAACALNCEHCRGRLLETMRPALTPDALVALGRRLVETGCQGVLISGGADREGQVVFDGYFDALAELKALGLVVIVHTGLTDAETARRLKEAGVDQALIDVIGDRETARRVYHLDKGPADYAAALEALCAAGLEVIPHVVVGLDFGQLRGELEALRIVSQADAAATVLVGLNPLPGTPMAGVRGPSPEDMARLVAVARLLTPTRPVKLGCARAPGPDKPRLECLAIDAGINAIAYPTDEAIAHARARGLSVEFAEVCCSLV